jgi:Ca2+-binding EF-hand superfamily protein
MLTRMGSKKSKTAVDFLECFRVFDREQNGTINIGELKHVMSTLGEGLTLDEINDLTKGMETKGEGNVSIDDFVRTVMDG